MRPKLIISLLYLCCLLQANAQKETGNWYFSDQQGFSFNSGTMQPIGGIPANIFFNDFTTVCSDAAGNLKFIYNASPYAVLNRNYQQMAGLVPPPGNAFLGKPLWVKFPGSASKYFVFYPTGTSTTYKSDLRYSIIDMSLSGGLGQVIATQVIVDTSLSTAFCIINKTGSDDFWIISNRFRTDSFYARLVTSAGVSSQANLSRAGLNPYKTEYNFLSMRASHDGKLIAGGMFTNYSGPFLNLKGNLEVFNFNKQTGAITNRVISTNLTGNTVMHLEFSADSKLLYSIQNWVAVGLQPCGFANTSLFQYNLCYGNNDSVAFTSNAVLLGNRLVFCSYPFWGSIQLAPDKQIYMRYPGGVLSSVKYPNKRGTAANLVFNYQSLPNATGVNVPSFGQPSTARLLQRIDYSGGCYPAPLNFSLTNDGIDHVLWNFGDPGSGAQNTSTAFTPSHIFSMPGTFTVTATLYDINNVVLETVTEILQVKDPTVKLLAPLPMDTVLCTGSSLFISLAPGNHYYEWSKTNPGNPTIIPLGISDTITINTAGTYYLKMTRNGCSECILYDSIHVTLSAGPPVNLGADRLLCTGQTIRLGVFDPANNVSCVWSTGETTDSISVTNPGQYWVRAEMNNNGCIRTDTINILNNPVNDFSLPADTLLCNGQVLLLNAAIPGATYLWHDNSTAASFTVTSPGLYWVRVELDGCVKTDSINVSYVPGQQVLLGADTSLCSNNNLVLSSNVTGTAYIWSNGATTPSILVNNTGLYWIRVLLNTGCWTTDSINVQFNPVPYFSFGSDTALCENSNLLLTTTIAGATYLWQDNSTANSYLVNNPGLYWLEVSKDGCIHRDSLFVTYMAAPVIDLGVDTSICSGSSLLLDATHSNTVSYLWQDASANPVYSVSSAGLFYVEVTAANGCKKADSIQVMLIPLPAFSLGNDSVICFGDAIVLQTNIASLPHQWSTGSLANSIIVNSAGLYWVEVDNFGCKKRDSVNVFTKPSPVVNLGSDTVLCDIQTMLLDAANNGASYLWHNGSTQPRFSVSSPGIYHVAVNINGCYSFDTVTVAYNYKPMFSLGPNKAICNSNSLLLDPGVNNANYLWQDGSTYPTYLVRQTGQFSVMISNECGSLSDTVIIQKGGCELFIPNSFTPNGDGKNDIFRPLTFGNFNFYEFTVFNRYGKVVFSSNDPKKGWNGNYMGKDQDAGTYVWKCIYQIDKMMKNTETGTVILIR